MEAFWRSSASRTRSRRTIQDKRRFRRNFKTDRNIRYSASHWRGNWNTSSPLLMLWWNYFIFSFFLNKILQTGVINRYMSSLRSVQKLLRCFPYFLYKEHQTSVKMLKYLWWYIKQSSKRRGINLFWGHNVSIMNRNGRTKQVNYLFITIECVVLEFGKAKPIIRYSYGPPSLMRFSWYQNLYIQTKWVRDLFTTNRVFLIFDICL